MKKQDDVPQTGGLWGGHGIGAVVSNKFPSQKFAYSHEKTAADAPQPSQGRVGTVMKHIRRPRLVVRALVGVSLERHIFIQVQ